MARKSRRQAGSRVLAAEKLAKKIVSEIDAPVAAISGMSHIEISGGSEAVIQGCQGIIEYGDELIRLSLGRSSVLFRGKGLIMKSYSIEQIIIEGAFLSIEFG